MPQLSTKYDRVWDFAITAVVFTFFNYYDRYSNYTDAGKRFLMSLFAGAAAGLILALIKPPIKRWLSGKIKKKGDSYPES